MSEKTNVTYDELLEGTVSEAGNIHERRVNGGHEQQLQSIENQKIFIECAPHEAARSIIHGGMRFVRAIHILHDLVTEPSEDLTDHELLVEQAAARQGALDFGAKLIGNIRTFVSVRRADSFTFLQIAANTDNAPQTELTSDDTSETKYSVFKEEASELVMKIATDSFEGMLQLGATAIHDEVSE